MGSVSGRCYLGGGKRGVPKGRVMGVPRACVNLVLITRAADAGEGGKWRFELAD